MARVVWSFSLLLVFAGCSPDPNHILGTATPDLAVTPSASTSGQSHALAVVRTQAQLEAQPALSLGAARVHLGVETLDVGADGGLLVYALVEGDAGGFEGTLGEQSLGPLNVRIRRPGQGPELEERCKRVTLARDPALFVASVCVPGKGEHQLEVLEPSGAVLASAVVRASPVRETAWVPLHEGEPGTDHEVDGREVRLRLPLSMVGAQRAWPRWDGDVAWPPRTGATRERVLPGFVPLPGGLTLTLEADGSLRATFDPPLAGSPHGDWLATYWVNGIPWSPAARAAEQLKRSMNESGQILPVSDVWLLLSVDPELLGARRGDLLELALLYCPQGSQPAGVGNRERHLTRLNDEEVPRTSDRLAFVLGQPGTPQLVDALFRGSRTATVQDPDGELVARCGPPDSARSWTPASHSRDPIGRLSRPQSVELEAGDRHGLPERGLRGHSDVLRSLR